MKGIQFVALLSFAPDDDNDDDDEIANARTKRDKTLKIEMGKALRRRGF